MKKIKLYENDLVNITFVDVMALDSTDKKTRWVSKRKIKKHCDAILAITSVGRFVYSGTQYIAITMSEKKGMLGPHQLIPHSAIIDIKKINDLHHRADKRKVLRYERNSSD